MYIPLLACLERKIVMDSLENELEQELMEQTQQTKEKKDKPRTAIEWHSCGRELSCYLSKQSGSIGNTVRRHVRACAECMFTNCIFWKLTMVPILFHAGYGFGRGKTLQTHMMDFLRKEPGYKTYISFRNEVSYKVFDVVCKYDAYVRNIFRYVTDMIYERNGEDKHDIREVLETLKTDNMLSEAVLDTGSVVYLLNLDHRENEMHRFSTTMINAKIRDYTFKEWWKIKNQRIEIMDTLKTDKSGFISKVQMEETTDKGKHILFANDVFRFTSPHVDDGPANKKRRKERSNGRR